VKSPNHNPCWFESWFDSPYYHLLYGNRDQQEADNFINRLVDFLQPPAHARVLDLACGKGRHSIALHKKNLEVTGIDLSEKNIQAAKKSETEGLSFFVHDMRFPFMVNYFDYTFNLFTSFGYFSSYRENARVVSSVKSELKKNGIFVIDFLNAAMVKKYVEKTNSGTMEAGGITFHWKKRIENEIVLKDISFEAENKKFTFTENVQLLTLPDFEKMLAPCFTIEHIFGDYNLGKFDEENSPRLILIARKK
jgi:SAM-dependent methyltransferase